MSSLEHGIVQEHSPLSVQKHGGKEEHLLGKKTSLKRLSGCLCSIIVTAFLGTSIIFLCFTLSALYAKRRSYLFLGGRQPSSLDHSVS